MRTYFPLLRIEHEQILCLLLVADPEVILDRRTRSGQGFQPFALLLGMLVVLLESEIVDCSSYMCKVCLSGGEQLALDQSFSVFQSLVLRTDLPILTRNGLARRRGRRPARGEWWGYNRELDDVGHRGFCGCRGRGRV